MVTEKKIAKAIIKHFKVEDTILNLGTIKKHSNVCWEYVKNEEDMAYFSSIYSHMAYLMSAGKIQEKSLPFRHSIMGYNFNRLVICKNKDTGFNLLTRHNIDPICIDTESIKIDGEDYYILY